MSQDRVYTYLRKATLFGCQVEHIDAKYLSWQQLQFLAFSVRLSGHVFQLFRKGAEDLSSRWDFVALEFLFFIFLA